MKQVHYVDHNYLSALQVIEVFIRAEDGLCREVVKHLNHIEEQILESMAWKQESILWDRIRDNENKVPSCEEVSTCWYVLRRFPTQTGW